MSEAAIDLDGARAEGLARAPRAGGVPTAGFNDQARAAGLEARRAGQPDSPPIWTASVRSLRVAWLEGWHAGAPPVLADDAPAPAVSLEERWPEGRALPEAYLRPMIPCPACRLVRTDKGRRAALMVSGGTGSVVHFACRECGHGWKLPARSA